VDESGVIELRWGSTLDQNGHGAKLEQAVMFRNLLFTDFVDTLVSSSAEIFVVLLPVMLKCVAINLPM
jgi:hypothetical protein